MYIYIYIIYVNLSLASSGFPNDPRWNQGASELINNLAAQHGSPKHLQKIMYVQLMKSRFGDNLSSTIEGGLHALLHPFTLDFHNSILLRPCFQELKKLRVADSIKVLKGWCNGWATSRRFANNEDKILPCLLGCNRCSDDLAHYLQCPHLLALWIFIAGRTDSDPLERWGLICPSVDKFKRIACIFSAYHAVRRFFREKSEFFSYNMDSLSGQQIRLAWSVFADAFLVEARELAVDTRKFSLPSFLSFLNDNR